MAARHPAKSPAQRRALDAIGCGNNSPIMSSATRDALLRQGLIVEIPPRHLGSALGPIRIAQFEMPVAVHMQWCNAVSEEPPHD